MPIPVHVRSFTGTASPRSREIPDAKINKRKAYDLDLSTVRGCNRHRNTTTLILGHINTDIQAITRPSKRAEPNELVVLTIDIVL